MSDLADFPYEVTSLRNLDNPRARDLARDQLFQPVWLRRLLPAAEWQGVAHLPLSLVKDLYRDVWMLGPHSVEFKTFWGALMRRALGATPEARRVLLVDLRNTYQDRVIERGPMLNRHTYFDARHAFVYGQMLGMGWYGNTGERLLKRIWDADKVTKRSDKSDIEAAVGLLITVILTQHLTPHVEADGWQRILDAHTEFCARWGFPHLSTREATHVS